MRTLTIRKRCHTNEKTTLDFLNFRDNKTPNVKPNRVSKSNLRRHNCFLWFIEYNVTCLFFPSRASDNVITPWSWGNKPNRNQLNRYWMNVFFAALRRRNIPPSSFAYCALYTPAVGYYYCIRRSKWLGDISKKGTFCLLLRADDNHVESYNTQH